MINSFLSKPPVALKEGKRGRWEQELVRHIFKKSKEKHHKNLKHLKKN